MKKIIAMSSMLLISACASYPDVRPGVDGIHEINVRGENIKDTESNAYKQVNAYCKSQKKTVDLLSDDSFKATPDELNVDKKLFKKAESATTDVKFKCVEK